MSVLSKKLLYLNHIHQFISKTAKIQPTRISDLYVSIRLYTVNSFLFLRYNCISNVMVSMLVSNEVGHWFEAQLGQTKDYKIGT